MYKNNRRRVRDSLGTSPASKMLVLWATTKELTGWEEHGSRVIHKKAFRMVVAIHKLCQENWNSVQKVCVAAKCFCNVIEYQLLSMFSLSTDLFIRKIMRKKNN